MQFTDTSEKAFQKLITAYLVNNNRYLEGTPQEYDREFCVNKDQLFQFIQETQPVSFDVILKKGERNFLSRLDEKISQLGIIEVLRKGIKYYDKTIELFYNKPVSIYNPRDIARYNKNIFSVTQELKYSLSNENRLDLVIFINGLPISTLELKNAFTNQAVKNAIRQYQTDRDPKEKLFSFARCVVHFAADTDLVYMTTHLKGKQTDFLPFNKGFHNGAGNPVNPDGLKTHYLWEEILTKDILTTIIEKYAQLFEEKDEDTGKIKKKVIFPRYHQISAVTKIIDDAKENGVGQKYLIQHSAGSGKSSSIAWLAHQLIGLFESRGENHIFDSVIVISDRNVIDRQLRDTIKQFAQIKGIVEPITGEGSSKTNQLKEAINNKKKIIITTIQTFPHLLEEMQEMSSLKFAIIIDEAHSSQSGESAAKMNAVLSDKENDEDTEEPEEPTIEDKINELIESRRMIKNGSYFAFTATPKNKTLEMFGVPIIVKTPEGDKKQFFPFHLYSMKQAIEEEFILDVLENYTTYTSFYKLIKSVESNPLFETREAQKKLRAYVEEHEFAIAEKSKIMIDHFHREVAHLIDGRAKAMIVAKNILAAIKFKFAFDEYLKQIHSPYKAIVAFSGKKTFKGIEYDEAALNKFTDKNNDIVKQFRKNENRFLIVANKFQTGFDQPLLHTMYVDKKLSDVQAVQTLSRLNRSFKPFKKDTFVLDFFNKSDDIKEAFKPYYTSTMLAEETDPNKLNDLQDSLDKYEIYSEETVKDFFQKYIEKNDRNIIEPIIDASAALFKFSLDLDKQIDFKIKVKSFLRTYSYLSKILDFKQQYWEQLWWFLKLLNQKLIIDDNSGLAEGITETIDMDSYRPSNQGKVKIQLVNEPGVVEPIPVTLKGGKPEPELDTLENILKVFNQRFGDIEWSDKDKVHKILVEQLPAEMEADSETMNAIKFSDKQNAKITSDKKIEDLMQQYLFTHTEIFKKFMSDQDFQRRYKEFIFDKLWHQRQVNNSPSSV